jgi:DHA1 family bicyclomycin/chloramphenicol resistance-like MFS transporter
MTEEVYSYYFGFNALGALVGPLLYIRLSRWISPGNIITAGFGLLTLCGIVLNVAGSTSPVVFALTMATATVALSLMRPPTANLLLSQQEGDTGSAASLINFMGMLMGSMGMVLISLETENLIPSLGLMQIIVGAVCGSLWLMIRRRSFICQPA